MEENYANIKERVLYFAKKQGVSIELFLESIGMTYGSFKGKAKEGALNSNAIAKILTKYPSINPSWLLLNEGKMFISRNPQKDGIFSDQGIVAENGNSYKLTSDQNTNIQQIPLYNIEASAGIVSLFKHQNDDKAIDFITIPDIPKCDGAIYVTGDSMYPLLKSGDIIMYKEKPLERDMMFIWGEMYLVSFDLDDEEYVTIKWVQKSEKGDDYIKLVSQNQHHQPMDIPKSKLRACAMVKASIRINAMN